MLQDWPVLQRAQQAFGIHILWFWNRVPRIEPRHISLKLLRFPPANFPFIPLQSSIHVPRNVGSEHTQYRQALLPDWLSPEGAGGQYVNRQQAWDFFSQGTFLRGLSLMNLNCLLLRKIPSSVDKKSPNSFVYELTGFIDVFT